MKNIILLILTLTSFLNAQNLEKTIEEVLSTNPTILQALKNYNSTKEDVTSAQSGYYPKLDLTLGAGKEKTNKNERPATPNQEFDYTVYQNSLTLTQNVFNGFKTTYAVEQQENRTVAAAYKYVETVNDTSFEMLNSYLNVIKNAELLEIEKENVQINEEISIKVKKLYDSGLTTLSEVNKIDSSLALARSNLVVQENTLLDVTYALQRILGRELDPNSMEEPVFNADLPKTLNEATQFAMLNNPSMLVGRYNVKLAQATYKEKKAPFYPSVDLELSQSMNKNLSAAEGEEDKLRAMAYLKYNIFNGFADTSALQKSVSEIHKEVQIKNTLKRDVIEGISLSWAANEKLSAQLKHLEDYKMYSLKTLSLYTKEYDLGRRSLLDLLSAQNDFIGSKSQIINTKYSMLFAKYRILDAMGVLVPALLGDKNDIVYSNVGLNNKTPENLDTLPIKLDDDNDLVVDEKDICSNSLNYEMKNLYGCKDIFQDTIQIERYSGFLFPSSSSDISSEGEDRMNNLMKQLKTYGFENINFDLLGHANIDGMSEDEAIELSSKRAQRIKEILIKNGVKDTQIEIHAFGDKAPMYTDETSSGKKLNNRVDIIVKKTTK